MARNSDKRPHELTLELFAKNPVQTPAEIDAYVNNGPYASKHIWFLRKLGYDISINKNGRTVVNYVFNGQGTAPAIEEKKPAKVAKAPKRQVADPVAAKQNKLVPKTVKRAKVEKTDEQIKAANLEKMKAVTAKLKKKAAAKKKKKTIVVDDVEQTFGTNGEVGTSFTVDGGWDSMDGINVADLIR